jgi:hypothetical protein
MNNSVARFGLSLIASVIVASCTTNRADSPAAEAAPQPLTPSKASDIRAYPSKSAPRSSTSALKTS